MPLSFQEATLQADQEYQDAFDQLDHEHAPIEQIEARIYELQLQLKARYQQIRTETFSLSPR